MVREAWRVQMMEFGRTPKQLYTEPHPRRRPTCCSCFSPGPGHAQSARPANVLHPTLVQVLLPHLLLCHVLLCLHGSMSSTA